MEAATQQRLAAAEAERAALVRRLAEEEDEQETTQEPTTAQTPALAPLPPEPVQADTGGTRSAPAPEPVPPLAPLPAEAERSEDTEYRSPVRDVQIERARDAEFRDRVAALDEHIVAAAVGDGHGGLEGMDGSLITGYTQGKIERYWDHVHDLTRQVLEMKHSMTVARRYARLEAPALAQRLEQAMQDGHFYWAKAPTPRPRGGGEGGLGSPDQDRQPGE